MYMHTHMYMYTIICTQVYVYAHICICTHMCTYTHVHTHTHIVPVLFFKKILVQKLSHPNGDNANLIWSLWKLVCWFLEMIKVGPTP